MDLFRRPLVLVPFLSSCLFLPSLLAVGPLDLRLEVMTGQQLAPVPGRHLLSVFNFKTNSTGRAVFGGFTRAPGEPPNQLDIGAFVKDREVIRKILHSGDTLPDGAGVFSIGPYEYMALDINESGSVAIVIPEGILLYSGTGLTWLARLGAAVPGTSLTIAGFPVTGLPARFQDSSFLTDSGAVTFIARLSDGTNAVLRAGSGGLTSILRASQALPGRPNRHLSADATFSNLVVNKEMSAFIAADPAGRFAFLHDGVTVYTVAGQQDAVSPGRTITIVSELQVNGSGSAVLAARLDSPSGNVPAVLRWSASAGLSEVVNEDFTLRNFPGTKAAELCHVSIDDAGRLFFGAVFAGRWAAVVMMKDDRVEVIAADGAPTPLGGTFRLLPDPPIIDPPPPPSFFLNLTPTNGREEIAFTADVPGTDYTGVPFLWSHGDMLAVPLQNQEITGTGGRKFGYTHSVSLGKDGRLILALELCCDWQTAVLSTEPAAPRVQYLPLLAMGPVGSVSYYSEIELANHSPFPGTALVEGIATYTTGLPARVSRALFLDPGATTRVSLADSYTLARGYAKVTVEGGAAISASLSIKLQQQGDLLSTAVIGTADPATFWEVQVDRENADAAFAVTNPGNVPGSLTLELIDADGKVVDSRSRSLAAGEHFVFLINDLFKSVPAAFVGRIRVRSDVPVLVGGLSLAGARLSGITAQSAVAAGREYLFPTVACVEGNGHEYRSGFVVHNPGAEDAWFELLLHDSSGEVRRTEQVALAAGQTKLIPIGGPFTGWARLQVRDGQVVVNQRLQFFEGELRSQMQLAPAMSKSQLYFTTPSFTWEGAPGALAIVNPYHEEQEVWVDAMLPGWEIAAQARVIVPANGRRSYYLSELFGPHVRASSLVRVRSQRPVAASAFSFYGLCMTPSLVF